MVLAQPSSKRYRHGSFGVNQVRNVDSVLAAVVSLAINVLPFYLARVDPETSGKPMASIDHGMLVEFVEVSIKTPDKPARPQEAVLGNMADDHPFHRTDKTAAQIQEKIQESSDIAAEVGSAVVPLESLSEQYVDAIRARILASWQSAGGESIPANCGLVIIQASGGDVISVGVQNCADVRADLLQLAVLRAQPLPYKGFEPAFSNRIQVVLSH